MAIYPEGTRGSQLDYLHAKHSGTIAKIMDTEQGTAEVISNVHEGPQNIRMNEKSNGTTTWYGHLMSQESISPMNMVYGFGELGQNHSL